MTHPSLEEILAQRIASRGQITFAEFMELALYWPKGGYYTTFRLSEPAQDYFTAPLAHPAFGALLALQLEEMWRLLGQPGQFNVVEPGAGSGQLTQDVLAYAHHLDPLFLQALRYVAVDRAVATATKGSPTSPSRLLATGLPFREVTGCILSNELLDALPVHRVTVRSGRLKEFYVAISNGRPVEIEDEPSTAFLEARLEEEQVKLQDGHHAEVCLELEPWVKQVATALRRGFVLTIDYGHLARDLYAPVRSRGTLRCYYRHTLAANPYERPGQQDLTAHVDFTAVASLGTRFGLYNQPLRTQRAFLDNLGLQTFLRCLAASSLGQRERDANRMGMLELARPGGMGEFKVLVQSKGIAGPEVTGVHGPEKEWTTRLTRLPLPLLDAHHLRLMEGRYPHTAYGWEKGWPTD